ncbi:MAG TPA: SusD/RagB family nutrient-binding outer membrane lipoprotein [Chryseosolibacter sp.]|nr:SusD/RagB family nutrient-binding outer membrane lipoprotein [Chryseosolibacter sp.]
MKKIISHIALTFTLLVTFSCDNGFDELNSSKTAATSLNPALILNNAIIGSSPNAGQLNYELAIVQQLISPNTGVLEGANFNKNNSSSSIANWRDYYRNVIRYTNDVIVQTADDPARSNLMNKARIIQAHAFMVISDTYGSIPYDDAGKGYTGQNFFPDYESQEVVYHDIIAELTSASAALDESLPSENDVLYNGNIAKWKKFGYSLLLRAGMRLSKVEPGLAQSTVATAFAGGVILANDDNAVIRHDANYVNNVGNVLNGTEAANFYLAAPFVDALKANDDPRLAAIAVRYVGANSGPAQVAAVATFDPNAQYGLPMGSTDGDADNYGAALPGGGTRYAFTQLDRNRMAKRTSPLFLVTASQTNLLLAEARFRNWIGAGTVDGYFAEGIRRHMDQMALFDPASAVNAADRDQYVASRMAVLAGNELEQINYEYWIASFLNGQEAWANFRRSGYPVLVANPFPGRDVDWITRLTYPPTEILVNGANVQAAIAEQGPDELDTKVWWDQ